MNKLNLLLLLCLVVSSLVLVEAAYDTRRLRSEMHRAEVESERLEGERKQLEAERQQQATSLRVDRTARERLAMRSVTPGVTMYESTAPDGPAAGVQPATAVNAVRTNASTQAASAVVATTAPRSGGRP